MHNSQIIERDDLMRIQYLLITTLIPLLGACQVISPIFVDYNGVRMDVAKWINNHQLLSMQQKRSMAQLSKAQQKLVRIDSISNDQKLSISKENSIALHCAHLHLSAKQIDQLQNQIFDTEEKERILKKYDQEFPKIKLDSSTIQCE